MQLTEGETGHALHQLVARGLARRVSGARADRWAHCADKALELVQAQQALLGLLLLRGAQTLNELFTRSQRMHEFDDAEQVAHQLSRLISKQLVVLLPRQSGQREDRYSHRLGGEVSAAPPASPADDEPSILARLQALEARVEQLEKQLAAD